MAKSKVFKHPELPTALKAAQAKGLKGGQYVVEDDAVIAKADQKATTKTEEKA